MRRRREVARGALLWTACLLAAGVMAPLRAASPESEEYRGETAPAGADETAPAGEAAPALHPSFPAPAADSATATPPAAAADTAPPATGHPPGPPARLRRPIPAAGGPRRVLALLPTAAARDARPAEAELETLGESLRMGAEQTGRYRILAPEETARPFGRPAALPRDCFAEECAAKAARRLGGDFLLLSAYAPPAGDLPERPGSATLSLVLLDARTGRVARAIRARACPGPADLIPFAQQAVWRLLLPADSAAPGPAHPTDAAQGGPGDCDIAAEMAADSGSWRSIPWLNPAGAADNRLRWAAVGGGMLAAGIALAWAQGQLLGEDPNAALPGAPLRPDDGASSWLRGFFAAPNPGARIAALGGAGLALSGEAGAALLNPAALADRTRESASAARRNLPGGAPSFLLAYAGPLRGGLSQGWAIQHEGDDLANETTLHAGLAGDWGALSPGLAGIRSGAALKGYLAKVGSGGTGADRSTGHSAGFGLDLGLTARLSPRFSAAAAVRDALGWLRHTNTFTNRAYGELLPPEYRLGAAYQVDPTCLLVLDGQKGMVADQVDHVRLGAEKYVFRFLALRAGLHQAFGRQAVRKLSAGFGIDSEGLSDRPLRGRVSLGYAYDFGLDEDAPLGTGQSFSLEASW